MTAITNAGLLVARWCPTSTAGESEWELLLTNRARVVWTGRSGEDAAHRYVDCHREAAVIAWRGYPQHGMAVYGRQARILEPGDPGWDDGLPVP